MPRNEPDRQSNRPDRPRFEIRVPGFVSDEVVGLGDAVKRATATAGIRHCGGCARRAEALNRVVAFRGSRHQ